QNAATVLFKWITALAIAVVYGLGLNFMYQLLFHNRLALPSQLHASALLALGSPLLVALAGEVLQFFEPMLKRHFGTQTIGVVAFNYFDSVRRKWPRDRRLRTGLSIAEGMEWADQYMKVLAGGKNRYTGRIFFQVWMLALAPLMRYTIIRRSLGLEFDSQ